MDPVVDARVEDLVPVHGEPFAEVHVVAVRSEVALVEGGDDNRPLPHFVEDLAVGQDHE